MKQNYRNQNRPGIISSTSIDPRIVERDISSDIRTLEPQNTPLYDLLSNMKRGPKPVNFKVEQAEYHEFDQHDVFNSGVVGTAANKEERYIRVTPAQISRPDTAGNVMYYKSQDKFRIHETGQVLQVVMTDTDSIPTGQNALGSTSNFALSTTLVNNGSTTNRTKFGEIILRNVAPEPVIPFTTANVEFMGRTIYESQNYEGTPYHRSWIYTYNFVESVEKTLKITRDQKTWLRTNKYSPDIWQFEQRQAMKECKKEVNSHLMYGVKSIDDISGRPTYHMEGLVPSIKDNISFFNPFAVEDFETMFQQFMIRHAFKYSPNGNQKIALVGEQFHLAFANAFKLYRRQNTLQGTPGGVSVKMDYYQIGEFKLALVPGGFDKQTEDTQWQCVVFDPQEVRYRPVQEFVVEDFGLGIQRDSSMAITWQGTCEWNRTQTSAILKPF